MLPESPEIIHFAAPIEESCDQPLRKEIPSIRAAGRIGHFGIGFNQRILLAYVPIPWNFRTTKRTNSDDATNFAASLCILRRSLCSMFAMD